MQTDTVTPEVYRIVTQIKERELALPALLFLSAHRPLAFVAGQLLHVASPVAHLCGLHQCGAWAALLSSPTGIDQLASLLQPAHQKETQR